MTGLSLMAESLAMHIPKGYLYAAIGFYIPIEAFNRVARRHFARRNAVPALRERPAQTVMRL